MAECSLEKSDVNGGGGATKCVPCESLDTSALLTRAQVEQHVEESLPLWKVEEKHDSILYLSRKSTCKNFQSALDCINGFGAIAEQERHHPDFHLTNYRDVEICMWTHSVSGITKSDIDICSMLSKEVDVVYSPKWLKRNPQAKRN